MATNATINTNFPPGVLQSFILEDPVYWGNHSEVEITLLPSSTFAPSVSNGEAVFSGEDLAIISELMEAAEQENDKELDRKIRILGEALDSLNHCEDTKWYKRSDSWTRTLPGEEDESEWPLHRVWAHFMLWPLNYSEQGDEIEEVLQAAEEDFDYEEWLNSKQYVKSLQKYNLHKLLAWDKVEYIEEHPKWSGEYKRLEQSGGYDSPELYNSYIKERYRVEVYVHTLNWAQDRHYAYGSTPYGDVYIPEKITNYLKDFCGIYEMDIALQDVEGAPGKKPNSFRWTCVYLHNNGFALE